mgnify:CR=1 FL=1
MANDVYATPASNFALITGPNMAGKSTYLRMTALVCLMAHVGCLVPASQAKTCHCSEKRGENTNGAFYKLGYTYNASFAYWLHL